MKKLLLIAALPLTFVGCSSSEEQLPEQPINITLSQTSVSISTGEDIDLDISGVDPNECSVNSDNEFVAYAAIYNGKLNVEAEHVGETVLTVKLGDAEAKCTVSVTPSIDYVGSTVVDWGITSSELKEKVEKPYSSYMDNSQRGSKDYTYEKSGYKVTNRYYFNNGALCGVEKVIKGSGSDSDAFLNITNSLRNYCEYTTSYSETINSYPKTTISGYIYSYPQKYYAIYEQKRYDILWETGSRPETDNVIYFAESESEAKEHKFTSN